MKNLLCVIGISFLALFSSHAFAANRCLLQLDKRTTNQALNLKNCDIKANDVQLILSYLNKHPKIKSLDLSENFIQAEGAVLLSATTTLTSLNLEYDHIGDEGAIALANNKSIIKLNVGANKITDKGAVALAKNPVLRALNLDVDDLTDQGVFALAQNTSLTELSLGLVHVSPQAIAAIAKNPALSFLKISGLTEESAQALISNKNLHNLVVWGDINVSEKTLLALASSLQFRSLSLQIVKSNRVIGALANNPSLVSLTLDYCDQMPEQVYMAFANSKHLQSLYFGRGNVHTINTIKALSTIPTLTSLFIYQLTDAAMREAAKNQHLKSFATLSDMSDAAAAEFSKNRSINHMLFDAAALSEKGIINIASMSALRKLEMYNAMHLTPKAAQALVENENLSDFLILIGEINDADAMIFSKSKRLKRLSLMEGDITDQGALAFANNSYERLSLSSNFISDNVSTILKNNLDIIDLDVSGQG